MVIEARLTHTWSKGHADGRQRQGHCSGSKTEQKLEAGTHGDHQTWQPPGNGGGTGEEIRSLVFS